MPRITREVIAVAKSSGATILFPGNVYVLGDQPGPWDETTPHRAQLGAFTDVPFPGHAFSARQLKTLVEEIQGTPLKLSPFPWRLMTLASPFWELARELREMRYLYSHPHELGGAQLAKLLPEFEPTPLRPAITQALNARS